MRVRGLFVLLLPLALGCSSGCGSKPWPGPANLDPQRGGGPGEGDPSTVTVGGGTGGSGASTPGPQAGGPTEPPAVSGHPRLWVRAQDLPRLRGWAAAPGGVYGLGLRQVAERAKGEMDRKEEPFNDPDCADATGSYACEAYAELFAFMSLVSPSEAERTSYAERARTVLMRLVSEAAKGVDPKLKDEKRPIRSAGFSTDDRSRWHGEAFALTVDWIYPYLSASDKAAVRKTFLRWCEENVNSSTTDHDHPEPKGMVNNPALLRDRKALRFAGNNYFSAHMRNIGLMAMALDPKDDPGDELRAYLKNATGAWLYMVDHLMKGDAKGGMGPEGYEYGPQTFAYVMQLLWAMQTAGEERPSVWGAQATLGKDAFWDDALTAQLHLISPRPVEHSYLGPVYQAVWFGDGQRYWSPDFVDLFGPIGVYGANAGGALTRRADLARYIQTHYPPGGEGAWAERLRKEDTLRRSILYFMLFDPDAKKGSDPRAGVPLSFFAPGIGHYLARTAWSPDATWFSWNLGWISIDHQHADGNNFGFYRKGEWLTKRRVGYGDEIAATDSHNGVAIENAKPEHSGEGDYRRPLWKRGSQWINGGSDGDGKILARSEADRYFQAIGDATGLYNSSHENAQDVAHASRSMIWLKPDHMVIYDRAVTKTDRRFKRFWLQTPNVAQVQGNVATMASPKGQRLFVTKLLPEAGVLSSAPAEALKEEVAELEPMKARIKTEAPAQPRDVRFLHVLQGADGATPDPVTLVQSRAGAAYDGAVVKGTAVLVPRDLGAPPSEIVYVVPAGTTSHLVTGLAPGGSYDVKTQAEGGGVTVTVKVGGAKKADAGGALLF